jgi:UDP-N-acetylmuramoylalanine--D-glutamate ligase
MSELAGLRVLVVGLGASGDAAARVLLDEGAGVRVSERREDAPGAEALRRAGAEVLEGGHEPRHLEGMDLVVVSPGVPEHAPLLTWAAEAGLPVWSELELGARLVRAPYVAITGTNGKTTTTEMIAAAMREDGQDAVACGNIGFPFSLAAREDRDALSVEASSFQLRFHQTFHPRVSVLLNLSEDHLDWHGTTSAYGDAKARIFELQGPGDVHVGNADAPEAAALSSTARCERVWFTLGPPEEGQVGYVGGELVSRLDGELRLGRPSAQGSGFLADAAAAAAAALSFGLDAGAVGRALTPFQPLPHRGGLAAVVGGVRFIDDSKATNPHAALASLEGRSDVVLIAGGLSKGVDLTPLASAAPRLRAVVAIGAASGELEEVFADLVVVHRASSMQEAVALARDLAAPQGEVLLAPACASQDMFRDYEERGEAFAAAALRLAEEAAAHG